MNVTDPRAAALTDNTFLPRVAERLRAEIAAGAHRLDVVTGYIAPSAWAVLGDALAQVGQTRILLGKDYQLAPASTAQQETETQALVSQALRSEGIPTSLPTQENASMIATALAFLRRDDVEVKVWTDGFLHAKAYILPGTVGVGSANFTAGGLVSNRELVAWREDRPVVAELQSWFARYWSDVAAVDYKQQLIDVLDRTTFGAFPYTPYQVLIRTLASRYGEDRPPSLESATFNLKWFQEDAVFRLIQMTEHGARGALLADAVGLGKTFMALGVIHHFLYSAKRGPGSGPPVLVLVPASMVPIWSDVLGQYGLLWACTIASLQSLDRDSDVTPLQGAGLVVIDEAHRLRSRGVWYRKVLEILTGGAADKRVLLLTASPVHTGIRDLTTLLQVLTKNRRNVYAPAIADFESYLKRAERGEVDAFPVLDRSVVRRSRTDILLEFEQRRQAGMIGIERPKLPDRTLHHVTYDYAEARVNDVFTTFASTLRSLRLAPYDLAPYEKSARQAMLLGQDEQPESRPGSLAALVAAGLLKRFESSLRAFTLSLNRLDLFLQHYEEALRAEPPRLLELAQSALARQLLDEEREADEDRSDDLDAQWQELLKGLPTMAADRYDLEAVRIAIEQDKQAISTLRKSLPPTVDDGKMAALRRLFQPGGRLHNKRTLLFTQYRDTAIYAHSCLSDRAWRDTAGVKEVALVHGGVSATERTRITASFDPDRAAGPALGPLKGEEAPPQILVSTDVLAEGHNLQLAEAVISLDLPWNPQIVVQRSGRIDRLNSPHPRVLLVSFLPQEGLEAHLGLVQALERRFRLIHLLGLGDEPVTKLKGDQQQLTFEQMRRLYADDVSVLDEIERTWTLGSTDFMRAPLEAFLSRHAREKVREIPLGVQSVKTVPTRDWRHGCGAFLAFDYQGESIWRFYPRSADLWGTAVNDEVELFKAIACSEREPRQPWATPFPGPGGIIDWPLLRRAADEVAEELTRRRATAALQRGASERSRSMRLQILDLSNIVGNVDGLTDLLDRLEEVRVEDFDHRHEMRPFRDGLRAARQESTAGERHDLLLEVVKRGIELFGRPEGEVAIESEMVSPEDLKLVAWELLVEAPKPERTEQIPFTNWRG
jgi:superfamily II DNA or RNA helicase